MVHSTKDFDFSKLSVPQRIQLAQDLWDSVHDAEVPGFTPEQREELGRRLRELRSGQVQGIPWEEIHRSLLSE
jgi:putative addiction module component (TIGR02574 family)